MLKGTISENRTPDKIILNTISEIGRFEATTFYPSHRKKTPTIVSEREVSYSIEGIRTYQTKHSQILKNITSLESDISMLQNSINRHQEHMIEIKKEHLENIEIIKKQIQNRKNQISKIENSQEPPTANQIFTLVRQIQVEGMAAKRKAENCLKDQDINIILSGERIRKFHDSLLPKMNENLFNSNPKLKKSYDRLENNVFKVSETQTQLRSLKIYSTNLERRIVEMNSQIEALQFEKADIQMAIVDRKEEFHSELTKRCEELGKIRWKIEYLKALKIKMNEPHFNVRKIDIL